MRDAGPSFTCLSFISGEKMMMIVLAGRRLFHVLALLAAITCGVAQATPVLHALAVDVTGVADNDERGAASNIVRDYYVGANASIISLAWDLNLTSYDGSYLSEIQLTFSDTLGNGVTFTPGDGDDDAGTMDYAGFQDLTDPGLAFNVGDDGLLRLEFHDLYKDLAFDEPDGMWNFGTLIFGVTEVPEPSTSALMIGSLLLLSSATKRRHPALARRHASRAREPLPPSAGTH